MFKNLCRSVLFTVVSAQFMGGCYESGTPNDDASRTTRDGGVLSDAQVQPDARPALDAAFRCEPMRPEASCFEHFAIPQGTPFALPFQFRGAACCSNTECLVEADEASRTVRITTSLCPDTCDCDPVNPPRGVCDLPPLRSLGAWTVIANDTPAFSIRVTDTSDPTELPAPPACVTYAHMDSCSGSPDLTAAPVTGSVCLAERLTDLRSILRMTRCSGCGLLNSVCDVVIEPRLTFDLPPGGDIHLAAREYASSCDVDCPAECVPRAHECIVPPLVDGDFYRVFVDGEVVQTFVGGEPLASCSP